jgi:hypothetical protein
MKICIACGMPIRKKNDYPLGDESLDYCKFCARPDGTMQSYEEKLIGLTENIYRTKKMDRETARRVAVRLLAALPAWQGIAEKENR